MRTIRLSAAAAQYVSFQAARSLADLARGLAATSRSEGVTIILLTGCQRGFINCSMKSAEWVTDGSRSRSVTDMLALASMSMPWKCRLTMRSSSEWKLRATQTPPGRSSEWAASRPECNSLSSLLTNIRSAWNVLVAQWAGRPNLSRPVTSLQQP